MIELGAKLGGHRRRRRRVEAIPEPPHQLNPLVGGERVDLKRARFHGRNYV